MNEKMTMEKIAQKYYCYLTYFSPLRLLALEILSYSSFLSNQQIEYELEISNVVISHLIVFSRIEIRINFQAIMLQIIFELKKYTRKITVLLLALWYGGIDSE